MKSILLLLILFPLAVVAQEKPKPIDVPVAAVQALKKIGKGLGRAGRIENFDSTRDKTGHSETHCHTVVVIRPDCGRLHRLRCNEQSVRKFFDGLTDATAM